VIANGIGLSGTGSVFMVTTGSTTGTGTTGGGTTGGSSTIGTPNNCGPGTKTFGITQTVSGKPASTQMNVQCNVSGSRLTWIQRR
jgi:hypothetical protein